MTSKLVARDAHPPSQLRLSELYGDQALPAEKKPFLVDLDRSAGPFLSVANSDLAILDAASQIATMGLGLNHSAMFGAAEYLSSWIDDTRSTDFSGLEKAFADLLRRLLGSPSYHVSFCGSGAEGIERALAICFANRRVLTADRLLAFVGAFHGRTKSALEATWSPEKREPFSWPDHAAIFAPYPESDESDPARHSVPDHWLRLWSDRDESSFVSAVESLQAEGDGLLRREIESLSIVRRTLHAEQCFAIVIEPMQSEGGDRYSSARFHQGLAALARCYRTPLIYDEIQTGFHLGNRFFWHQQFDLTHDGQTWIPDVVVAAKKAQVGVVLARHPSESSDSICPASLARGYAQGTMLDQFSDEILKMGSMVRDRLARLIRRHASIVGRPRNQGLAFALDFADPQMAKRAIASRFQHGLLAYPAGDRTIRFRLNLSFDEPALDLLFEQLDGLIASLSSDAVPAAGREVVLPSPRRQLDFHQRMIHEKLSFLRGTETIEPAAVVELLEAQIRSSGIDDREVSVRLLDRQSYPSYRDRILQIQVEVYEPARQTPGTDFDRVFASRRPLAIVVERSGVILGMAFAGPLNQFAEVHGVATDPLRDHSDAAYMVDATVAEPYRGKLGRLLKQAIVLLALANGYRTLHGRNRDRLARGMWAINVGLGSYVTRHLENDYDDHESFRDCLYYRCPVVWEKPEIQLSRGISAPFGIEDLTEAFVTRNLTKVVNKLTLSNFVDSDFVADLEFALGLFPAGLRHGYTASSLSEATDKIVKSLWIQRRPRSVLISVRGHYFGNGTMLARSLSGLDSPRYPVIHVTAPGDEHDRRALDSIRVALESSEALALFVEPLAMRSMARLTPGTLTRIADLCRRAEVPLVFNDSAGLFYRYSDESFAASGVPGLEPDAVVASLGGQMAMSLMRAPLFISEPLKLISTWDGDGLSLAKFSAAARFVENDRPAYRVLRQRFMETLATLLTQLPAASHELRFGGGWVQGNVPESLAAMLERGADDRRLICPSRSAMQQWVDRLEGR